MRIKLQLGLHDQRQSLMAASKVHRPCRDQDRQPLARDNHCAPRSARISAAALSNRGQAVHLPPRSDCESRGKEPDGAQPTAADDDTFDGLAAVGLAVHYLTGSEYHSNFALSDYLQVEVFPALASGQAYFFVDETGLPVGLITWARVSEEISTELQTTGRSLRTDEWTSGPHLFVNDLIAEHGTFRKIINGLRGVFPDTTVTATRRNRDGSIRKASKFNRKIGPHFESADPKSIAERDGSFARAICCDEGEYPRICICNSKHARCDTALTLTMHKGKSHEYPFESAS